MVNYAQANYSHKAAAACSSVSGSGPSGVVITDGPSPVLVMTRANIGGTNEWHYVSVPPVDKVNIVDTNGAGDSFVAGFLAHALRVGAMSDIRALIGVIDGCVSCSNAAAARTLCCTGFQGLN